LVLPWIRVSQFDYSLGFDSLKTEKERSGLLYVEQKEIRHSRIDDEKPFFLVLNILATFLFDY